MTAEKSAPEVASFVHMQLLRHPGLVAYLYFKNTSGSFDEVSVTGKISIGWLGRAFITFEDKVGSKGAMEMREIDALSGVKFLVGVVEPAQQATSPLPATPGAPAQVQ